MAVREYSEDELKIMDNVDIVEVIGRFVDLNKHGNSYKGFSPFKSENTPSFSVKPSEKIFKDFSTGIGGNVISFYSRMKGITYRESMEELASIYGIRLSTTNKKSIKNETIYHKILKDANEIFKKNLFESKEAIAYMQNRGYNLENIKKYSLGYAKNDWNLLLDELSLKYKEEDIFKAGLISKTNSNDRYFDVFRDRIIFPIFNTKNQIIGFGGRYIGNEENIPKYINSVETEIFKKSNELYGIFDMGSTLKNSHYAILTEGYLDVLKTHINGFETAVASLGTAFTENQARLLKRYVDSVIILYDNDEAGKNATQKAINILNSLEFNIRCLNLPNGLKDPDEYFNKYTSKDFLELLKEAKSSFEYIYEIKVSSLNLSESSAKIEAIKRMKDYFENISNYVVRKDDLFKFSKLINVDLEYLEKEYKILKSKFNHQKNIEVKLEKKNIFNIREMLEKRKIEALMYSRFVSKEHIELVKKIQSTIPLYQELEKKLDSIEYNLENLENIYLTKDEEDMVCSIMLDNSSEFTDKQFIKLIKDWFNLIIDELMSNIDDEVKLEYINRKFKITKIRNKLSKTNSIINLNEIYDEINELRGD